jgi:hypothetical protein
MPTSSFWDHPIVTIEKALHLRKQIEALKASLAEMLVTSSPSTSLPLVKEGRDVEHSTAAPFTTVKRRGRPKKVVVAEPAATKVDGRKGKRSAATRAKMAAAQQARWAKKKK